MDVRAALRARHSVRGFRSEPIPEAELQALFEDAQRAPSWCNIQPWRAWVTAGEGTTRVVKALLTAAEAGLPQSDFAYPGEYPAPYDNLRRECGRVLYDAMGISREDKAARWGAWLRNFRGFDAPHLAFVAMEKSLGIYPALDIGCWLQSVMLLATERGIGTCAQASLSTYPDVLRKELGIPENLGVLCGISLGYEDATVPANQARTPRAALDANITWVR